MDIMGLWQRWFEMVLLIKIYIYNMLKTFKDNVRVSSKVWFPRVEIEETTRNQRSSRIDAASGTASWFLWI